MGIKLDGRVMRQDHIIVGIPYRLLKYYTIHHHFQSYTDNFIFKDFV